MLEHIYNGETRITIIYLLFKKWNNSLFWPLGSWFDPLSLPAYVLQLISFFSVPSVHRNLETKDIVL